MRNELFKLYLNAQAALQSMKDECGQDLIEYALLGALISVATIATMTPLAQAISAEFTTITGDL
jgi:Flp pilus assembly pilin Flp